MTPPSNFLGFFDVILTNTLKEESWAGNHLKAEIPLKGELSDLLSAACLP
jgi:hypothetical protein